MMRIKHPNAKKFFWLSIVVVFTAVNATVADDKLRENNSDNSSVQRTSMTLAKLTENLESGKPLVFSTFGDSLSLVCFHQDYRQNYLTYTVDALRKQYTKAKVRIVHAGNFGTASRGLRETRFERYVLAHRPDVVFIMFGMNDCAGGPRNLNLYDTSLTELIRKTRESGALPIIFTENEILYNTRDGRIRQSLGMYMQRAVEVAGRMNVPVVNCFAEWKPLSDSPRRKLLIERLNDNIHPNLAGHRLFAKTILQTLWPQAAKFASTAIRTPDSNKPETATACLLPGPRGKQILRTSDGMWIALSGRRWGGRLSDLVFSFSGKERPNWEDFQHVTLIGQETDAVFDHQHRTLTGGMLLEQLGRVFVVFSWNSGSFFVSIDLKNDAWADRVTEMAAWQEFRHDGPFLRPTLIVNSPSSYSSDNGGQGLIYDGFLEPDGSPAVFSPRLVMAPGAGSEDVRGDRGIGLAKQDRFDEKFLLVNHHHIGSLQTPDGKVYYVAQEKPNGTIDVGTWGQPTVTTTNGSVAEMIVPSQSTQATAVFRLQSKNNEPAEWKLLQWRTGSAVVKSIQTAPGEIPLPWSDGIRDGLCLQRVATDKAGQPQFAYQSKVNQTAMELGLLTLQSGRIGFSLVPLAVR